MFFVGPAVSPDAICYKPIDPPPFLSAPGPRLVQVEISCIGLHTMATLCQNDPEQRWLRTRADSHAYQTNAPRNNHMPR